MKRKPIQITSTQCNNTPSTQAEYITIALCNDGTIWELRNNATEWIQLPEIPKGVKE